MRTIFVTGFEPFGGYRRNPSGEIAAALDGLEVGDFRIETRVLPVARARASAALAECLERSRPRAVLGLGLATDCSVVHVEQLALNLEDYASPDADGAQPRGESIDLAGPAALFTTLDVQALVDAIRRRGVPAVVSRDAGTFLCNRVFYELLSRAARAAPRDRLDAGFLHLPSLPDCVAASDNARASMSLEFGREAVLAALEQTARMLAAP